MTRVLAAFVVVMAAIATSVIAPPAAVAVGSDSTCDDPLTRSDIGGQYVGGEEDHTDDEAPPPENAGDGMAATGPRPGTGQDEPPATTTTLPPTTTTTEPVPACEFVYEMEYPVVGGDTFGSGFGAPREGGIRRHMGVDLMAPKMAPVVAVADGEVNWIRSEPGRCCYLSIQHDDGWESWYIHLNNDRFGTDDGLGKGIRPDLRVGDRVRAGELIGWVGDSGNAETTPPHLHFELHLPSGEPIDPVPSTNSARQRSVIALADEAVDDSLTDLAAALTGSADGFSVESQDGGPVQAKTAPGSGRPEFAGPFVDDDGLGGEGAFAALAAMGVPLWCDEWGLRVCPNDQIDGATAQRWISAVLGGQRDPSAAIQYPASQGDPGLNREAGSECGVSQLCEDSPISFGEAAAMVIGTRDGVSVITPAGAAEGLAGEMGCGPTSKDVPLSRSDLAVLLLVVTGQTSDVCVPVS